MTGHILVVGTTQSGKTRWANQLHRTWTRSLSIFFNTNEVDDVWGTRVESLREVLSAIRGGETRLVYWPKQPANPEEKPPREANAQLRELQLWLYRHARPPTDLWCQLLVDEGHLFPGVAADLLRRSLGRGIRIVVITQYPVAIEAGTRSQCTTRVIFQSGIEGEEFLRNKGHYPHQQISSWTANKLDYHWVSYLDPRGWRKHPKI